MDTSRDFKPTTSWMAEKYDEMNAKLFNGELGGCEFEIFTRGAGSQGGVLGWFACNNKGHIEANRSTRRMYYSVGGRDVAIVRDNFVSLFRPVIKLNGNYSGEERSFLLTLVHEMCHYYTYMYGILPKQGHGPEFRHICSVIESRSHGEFSIGRVASAEQMQGLDLNDEMKARKEVRKSNLISRLYAVFVFKTSGDVQLTTTSEKAIVSMISDTANRGDKDVLKVVVSHDKDLMARLVTYGYKKNMRTWRFWHVGDKDFVKELGSYECTTYWNEKYKPSEDTVAPTAKPKRIFRLRTSKGVIEYELEGEDKTPLYNYLKGRFPRLTDHVIQKLIDNESNYVEEGMKNVKTIIREVLDKFIRQEEDNIEITPNMNLGLKSPLEGGLE